MIRFAVCDTDVDFAGRLAATLHRLYDPCKVEYMYGPDALEGSLCAAPGSSDVLLTEIELRERSSIDIIGHRMKESSPLQVIYLTSKMEYCTAVYETRHIGFLLKPVSVELLRRTVDRAIASLERQKSQGIVIHRGGSVYVVEASSLLYVESEGRLARLFTDEERLETYEKMGNLLLQMDGRFLQCHKSYLVNMDRVRQFMGDHFLMENGAVVPISQSRRKAVREEFLRYLGREG